MVAAVLQAPERLPKGEVGDDVEGTPIVPACHFQLLLTPVAVLMQPLDQKVDVLRDERLLVHHCLCGKPMR